jgi:ABC-type sugar transport system ATPase subunit
MSAAASLVEVRGLTRRYPAVVAVDAVDLKIEAGQILGLVGPNGAGKSTLIKMLAGAVAPSAGEIRVDGEPVSLSRPDDAREAGLGFVHQELADVPTLSVAENVQLGLGYPKRAGVLINRRQRSREVTETLAKLQASIDPEETVGRLSVARRRLVLIARCLAADARLLVLDEPSASLTIEEVEHLHEVLRRLAAEGKGIVYVSHRLDEILALTDRVVVMRSGGVVADVPTATLDHEKLVDHLTGQSREARQTIQQLATASEQPHGAAPELLRVEGLTGGKVGPCSFSITEGEIVGIAGLEGAGRTELARMICGADPIAAGEIYVGGERAKIRTPADAKRAGVVLLPEDRRAQGLVMDASIRHNATLASLKSFRRHPSLPLPSGSREREATQGLISQLSIAAPDDSRPVRLLSGGNQQKVVLAKWLLTESRVLVFDEPTHGVDVGGKLDIYELVAELAAQGKGIVLISSEFEELVEICPRVLVMRDGEIVADLRQEISAPRMIDLSYSGSGDA